MATDQFRGDEGAPVTVVEYGDFECPYCRAAAPILRGLVEGSGGLVRLVWQEFPLFEVHPHALAAALAAEAARAQGRFWAMHDELFAHQDALDDASLRRYAHTAGVDPDSAAGPAAQEYAGVVDRDYRSGVEAGVRGTPTLFIDGELYTGRIALNDLRTATGLDRQG
ncbi:DsbA family protein [Cellulomonas chengniuliangii]|uniref:Thioredoxin domain-containing protein n=1 Tax=Cellulomonas chengniuliangii TaxID=2968084 RepID=A0ABY5KVN1_9CELL|nr:thioredoxin domain-containing protein [Cellulomonas chengniuliangii]MCC2310022.1 thioredoxin domain-containing protein [Cellulomonas chengniuliangii]UUI74581.1 thioredoxin domain-containing protein [Cellulomonas chengniuliangii]